jgi:hypothetical protein
MLRQLNIKPVEPIQSETPKHERENPEDFMFDLSFTIHDPTIKSTKPRGRIDVTVIDVAGACEAEIPLEELFDTDMALNYAYDIATRYVRSEKMLFLHTIEMDIKNELPEVLASAIQKVLQRLGSPTTIAVISSKLPKTLAFYGAAEQEYMFKGLEFERFKHKGEPVLNKFTGDTYWRTVDPSKMDEVKAPLLNLGKDSQDLFGVNINFGRNTYAGAEETTSFCDGDLPLEVDLVYTPFSVIPEVDDDIEIEDVQFVIGHISCERYNIHTLLDMPKAKHIVIKEDIASCVSFAEGEELLASILDDTTRGKVSSHFAMNDISEIIYIDSIWLHNEYIGYGAGMKGIDMLMRLIGTSRSIVAINPTPTQYNALEDAPHSMKGDEVVARDVEKLQTHFKEHGFVDFGEITGQPIKSHEVEGGHLLIRPAFTNVIDN